MNRRKSLMYLISSGIIAALAAMMPAASNAADKAGRIEGTWLGTFTYSDNSQAQGLMTFSGSSTDEGTLVVSGSDSLSFPFPCLTEQGVWARGRGNTFVASDTGFCFDGANENAFVGVVKARYVVSLSGNGEALSGRGSLAITRSSGEVVYSDTYDVSAARQHPEAP